MPDFPGMLARRRERAREIVTGLLDTPLGPGSRSDVRDLPGLLSDIVQGPVRSVGSDLFGSISAADVIATDRARVQAGGESQLMRAPGTGFRTDLLGRMVPVPEATPEQEQLAFDAVTGLIPGAKAATGAIGGIFAGQGARLADLTRWADAKRAVRTGELRNTNQLLPPKQIPPGQRPEVVRRETGWFRGKDGLWRFEIDDSQATINFGAFGTPGVRNVRADDMFKELGVQPGDEVALLGELLDHPTLYENYPHLRNTEVRLRAGMPNESLGGYAPTGDGRGIIELNKERFTEELNPRVRRNQLAAVGDDRKLGATARAADNLLSTLIHETQHAVQDFEGFAGGGNMRAIGEELMRRTLPESVLRAGMDLKNKAKASGITNIDDFDEDVVGAVLASKGIPTIGSSRNMVKRLALTSDDELAEQLRMTRGAKNPELWFRTYQRLAGEAEARNVSARRHLNVVERNLLSPTREGPPRAADIVMRANREGVEFPRNLPEGSLDVSQRSQILPSQLNLPRPDPGTTPPAVRSPMIMEEAVRPGLLQALPEQLRDT